MEQISLESLRKDLNDLKIDISIIKGYLIDDELNLEVSDEVVEEIKEAKKRGKFYSQEEVESMFK